jgi:hypothetical protein
LGLEPDGGRISREDEEGDLRADCEFGGEISRDIDFHDANEGVFL